MAVSAVGEQTFQRIIQDISEPVVVVNRGGQVLFANSAAQALLACCNGKPNDNPLGFSAAWERTEIRFQESDGKVHVRQTCVAETVWEGDPAWVATLHDITHQTRMREEIEAFLRHSPALIYVRDRGGRYTLANDRFASSMGREVREIIGQTDAALFPSGLARLFQQNHQRIVESGEIPPFEVALKQDDGEHVYLCHEFPLCDVQGAVYAVAGIRTEITERNRIEENLRKSQARQQAVLESSLDCVVVMDATERIVEFNPAAEQTFGYRRDEVLGRPMADVVFPPAVRDSFRSNLRRCLESGCERVFDRRVEFTAMHKQGTVFPIETAVSVARDGGDLIFTAVLHDITQRKRDRQAMVHQTEYLKRAVAALERTRERERQVLAAIPSIFLGLDDNGMVTHWNPAAEKQFGMPRGEVLGRHLKDLAIGWNVERFQEAIAQCSRLNEAVRFEELRVSDPQGRERILALTINRTEARADEDGSVVLVGTDVTDRKAMEAQLMLAQKMESIGQLAAGIAHEINTPTQYVSDNTRFLRDAFGDFQQLLERFQRLRAEAKQGPVAAAALEDLDRFIADLDLDFLTSEIPKAIEQSLEGLNRVTEIVRAMKQFSHPDQDQPELADLNKAIENTVAVARNEWKYVAEVDLDLDPRAACRTLSGRPLQSGHPESDRQRRPSDCRARRKRLAGEGQNPRHHADGARPRRDPPDRHGRRHSRKDPQPHLRPLLHHQASREGHRPGTRHRAQHHCRAAWRPDRGRVGRGQGHNLHPAPAVTGGLCAG